MGGRYVLDVGVVVEYGMLFDGTSKFTRNYSFMVLSNEIESYYVELV